MKNVLKTIAMILIMVMVGNSFAGCIIMGQGYSTYGAFAPVAMSIDLILLGSVILGVTMGLLFSEAEDGGSPQMAINAQKAHLSPASGKQTYVLSDQLEQFTFLETFNTLPKAQTDTLTQRVQAMPDAEKIAFIEAFNAIPQTDMIPVMGELNALSETELGNAVGYLNSLSETQFVTLINNIQDNAAYAITQRQGGGLK